MGAEEEVLLISNCCIDSRNPFTTTSTPLQLTAVPRVSTPRTARTTITALLHLQRVLALVSPLAPSVAAAPPSPPPQLPLITHP